jgi:alpha-galactosidase
MKAALCFASMGLVLLALPVSAQTAAAPSTVDAVKTALSSADHPPFAFTYGGKDAATLMPGWTKSEADAKSELGFPVHQIIYRDPATKLKLTVETRALPGFPAIDWVLFFSNEGTSDTPIIENILPLHTTMACDAPTTVLHTAAGSGQSVGDFDLKDTALPPGQPFAIGTTTGRSSDALNAINGDAGSFPFFNLQTGNHGTLGAIGWTSDWRMQLALAKDSKSVALEAGMVKTHLVLHPGETIRTPRLLLMDWQGDPEDAQNLWRKLMLADYSPKDIDGKTVTEPLCFCSGGNEPIANKLAVVQFIHDKKIPADLYWIDAGWYGDKNKDWVHNRGNWWCTPEYYPAGFKPLGDALKAAKVGFLVWVEAETAMPGTTFPTQHPDWYIPKPAGTGADEDWPMCLNLANPAALKGMTDYVSKLITDSGMTWYRQDFNFSPARYWESMDKPDRVGMTEIGHIEGLYAFWDALRAQHPGLQIDNCASGGRRIDLETMSRSVALHRSDAAGIPIGEQFHTQGLVPWVPLNDGIIGGLVTEPGNSVQLYNTRSGYCAGGNFAVDPKNFNNDAAVKSILACLDEAREIRTYYYGDFYPLFPQTLDQSLWSAWQLDRPDLKSGAILCLRRPDSIYSTLQLELKKIDPAATYEVEVRTTLEHTAPKEISGTDFAHFAVTIPDKPGSAVVFYHKK